MRLLGVLVIDRFGVKVVDCDHPLLDLDRAVTRKEKLPTSLLLVLLIEPHRGLDTERGPRQPL